MQQQKLDLTFYNNVLAGTQDPWQRMRENDPNGQTHRFEIIQDSTGQQHMIKQ